MQTFFRRQGNGSNRSNAIMPSTVETPNSNISLQTAQSSASNFAFTFGTDGHQLDSLARDEVQSLVDIGDFVEPHFASVGLGKSLPGDDLEEQHEFQAIPEVFFDVFDLCTGLAKMGVDPSGEGLKKKGDM